MAKQTVVILGTTGMLGSMLTRVFTESRACTVVTCDRGDLDASRATVDDIARVLHSAQWVINAMGITKPHIHDDHAGEVEQAIQVNAMFPHQLAHAARRTNTQVIQIATDCVYSGDTGQYTEADPHDATDVYGKTKSLGEVAAPGFYNLRCSIIGPEQKGHQSLLDWFLGQPKGSKVQGFTNHRWNGVTTLAFARICMGIIREEKLLPHVQHIAPSGALTKAQLLAVIAREYGRKDGMIKDTKARVAIDRTLATTSATLNRTLWRLGGYSSPPTIEAMIQELATYV